MNTASFEALKNYRAGSERAALLPIDNLVREAERDKLLRARVERQLLATLEEVSSLEAREYVCSKLANIGSETCVPAMAGMLGEPELSTAARNVLEAITDPAAASALRESLGSLQGATKVGAINSLGERRDERSVGALAKLLVDSDPQIAQAAAWALGRIGNAKAAQALAKAQPKAVGATQRILAEAALLCAETLAGVGNKQQARTLLRAFDRPDLPRHLRQAIQAALA